MLGKKEGKNILDHKLTVKSNAKIIVGKIKLFILYHFLLISTFEFSFENDYFLLTW